MASPNKIILVPTDFSEVASNAIEHAVNYSKILQKEITLIHIIKKDVELQEAESYMQSQVENVQLKHGIKVNSVIREGSIFSTIGEVSEELGAELVIMGTHGRKGMQKLIGSWALKVTVSTKAPVIIVKDPPRNKTLNKIVFPVDFKKENKEKIGWACFIAKVFDAKIIIYRSNFKDRGFLRGIISNMRFTERYFRSKEVNYEIVMAKPKKNFAEQTIEFAHEIEADLILITTTRSISIADYILGASEQFIIDNSANIPVMCINPREIRVGSFSATGN